MSNPALKIDAEHLIDELVAQYKAFLSDLTRADLVQVAKLNQECSLASQDLTALIDQLQRMRTGRADLGLVPPALLRKFQNDAMLIRVAMDELRNTKPDNYQNIATFKDAARGIITRIEPLVLAVSDRATSVMTASMTEPPTVPEEIRAQLEATIAAETKRFDEFKRDSEAALSSLKAQAEQVVASVKAAASDAGITSESSFFAELAKEHKQVGDRWLVVLILLVSVGVALAIRNAFVDPPMPGPNENAWVKLIPYASARVLWVSMLLYALSIAGRNYRSHRHNELVNKHRATALKTFQAFATATHGDDVRNAVLLQACQAIFTTQASGFTNADAEVMPQTTLLEIVRGAKDAKGS